MAKIANFFYYSRKYEENHNFKIVISFLSRDYMIRYKGIFIFFLILITKELYGQDVQFSQFYASPLNVNPAFTGATQETRFILNYRSQWPQLQSKYQAYAASFDHYFTNANSGVGLYAISNQISSYGMIWSGLSASYAYQLLINKKLTFRLGAQASYMNVAVSDLNGLTFGNQYNNDGFIVGSSPDENFSTSRISYFDLGMGGVLYSRRFWMGLSSQHITQPNLSFIESSTNYLPVRWSIHAGWKIPIVEKEHFPRPQKQHRRNPDAPPRETSFSPVINYRYQAGFQQMDVGAYLTYEPIVIGAWYRGLLTQYNDAVAFLLGIKYMNFNFCYSYDLTVSKLAAYSGGSHEISFIFNFYLGYRNQKKLKAPRNIRKLPCPTF